jgi:4-phosphopantoate--beta-alanine ligase
MAVPKNHPRYESLMTRERLQEMVARGIVSPTGMISHGRGEAFDYLMGEKSTAAALEAEKAAAAFLLNAERPVVCVNGNAAALGAKQLIKTAEAVGAKIEVNIFHRSEERMESIIEYMESEGAENVLGRNPDARISGLTSDRALCTKEGIFDSDVILVPIEDGDRAEALVSMGKTVISVDLNPLSRTSKKASVSISDEMNRALSNITEFAEELGKDKSQIKKIIADYDNGSVRKRTVAEICAFLEKSIEEE